MSTAPARNTCGAEGGGIRCHHRRGVDVDDVEDADASSSADRSVRSTSADIRS
jgi:hypothetical protein